MMQTAISNESIFQLFPISKNCRAKRRVAPPMSTIESAMVIEEGLLIGMVDPYDHY